jgi:hypothetical protein
MKNDRTRGTMATRGPTVVGILIVLIIVGVGAYVFLNQGGAGSSEPPTSADAQTAASQGLASLRQLVTADNFRGLGLDSLDQVASSALGEPLTVFRIQLDQLIAFKEADDPKKLLIDDKRITYPIVVNQEVVSSLSVAQVAGGGWRATDYGSANVVKALSRVRQNASDFIVEIPALKLYFIGSNRDSTLFLTPAIDDPRFSFSAGRAMSAASVILAVQPFANDYNGLPQ